MATKEQNDQYFTCSKCGRKLKGINYYCDRKGEILDMCKKCLTLHIENDNPESYLWILQKMDYPYVETEWKGIYAKALAKDPFKITGTTVIGNYLKKMRLKQWQGLSWADSERLNAEAQLKIAEQEGLIEENNAALKERLEKGEISQYEYDTLTSVENNIGDMLKDAEGKAAEQFGSATQSQYYSEENFISDDELPDVGADLTQEDKVYLAMKWGKYYTTTEWVLLEQKYTEMMNSFDIQDSDTIGSLIIVCKTYLKMNQALDAGDVEGFQKLSKVYESIRKSSKFTAAQKKDEETDFVDCVGNLVAFCEKEGGYIPRYKIETPLDIIDEEINDLKSYNETLVKSDPSISRQIEDYLKKKAIVEEIDIADYSEQVELSDDDMSDFIDAQNAARELDNASDQGDDAE